MKSLLKLPFIFAALLVSAAQAQVTVVTSAADLHATDSVSWGQLGPEGTASYTFSAVSTNGIQVTVSGVGLRRQDQGSLYQGNFAAGSQLLYTGDSFANTRVTFTFDTPILAAGFHVSSMADPGSMIWYNPPVYSSPGSINLYDADGKSIEQLTDRFSIISSKSTAMSYPSQFVGFSSTTPVSSFELLSWNNALGVLSPLAFDTLLLQAAPKNAEPNLTPVPEPSTYGLMGAGALALLGLARRSRSRKR